MPVTGGMETAADYDRDAAVAVRRPHDRARTRVDPIALASDRRTRMTRGQKKSGTENPQCDLGGGGGNGGGCGPRGGRREGSDAPKRIRRR
jgi:hypothetical protein